MSKLWWKCAGIRALKTVCQTAIAMIGTTAFIEQVNWLAVASASVLAGVLSILTSLAGLPEVEMAQAVIAEPEYDPALEEGEDEQPKEDEGVM